MFGSDIIDVAIGMCLIFLMASLICTAIQEGFEGMLKMCAADLAKGIRELLNDPDGSGIVKALSQQLAGVAVHPCRQRCRAAKVSRPSLAGVWQAPS